LSLSSQVTQSLQSSCICLLDYQKWLLINLKCCMRSFLTWFPGLCDTQQISALKRQLRMGNLNQTLEHHVQVNISYNNYDKTLCTSHEGELSLTTKEEADSSLLRDTLNSFPGNLHGTSPTLYLLVVWFDLQLLDPGIQISSCHQTTCKCSLQGLKSFNHEQIRSHFSK